MRVCEGARIEDIADLEVLAEAWNRVRVNKGGPGVDGVTIAEIAPTIETTLLRLSQTILAETYRPHRLRRFFIRKESGGRRPLSVPAVVDRIAQTAAMLALEPGIDERMSELSLGYRRGKGAPVALRAVRAAFAEGLVWTVDADIKNYFDTIWHRALASDLAVWIDDERILRLLLRWMRTFGWRGRGIAQGSPISPMFANIYLHPFDRLMAVSGWHVVRFADDFVVLTAGELNARRALQDAERLLRGRGLALNAEKTRIVPPDQIFTFLGATLSAKSVTKPLAPGGVPTADQS